MQNVNKQEQLFLKTSEALVQLPKLNHFFLLMSMLRQITAYSIIVDIKKHLRKF